MTTETSQIDTSNPLDMPLGDIKTERPLIKPGIIADFKVVKLSIMENPSKTLKVELEAVGDLEAKEGGGTIPAARAKLFDNINTEPTGQATWETIQGNVARLTHACGEHKFSVGDVRRRFAELQGKVIQVRVGYKAEGTGDDGVWRMAQNRIAEYIPKKA